MSEFDKYKDTYKDEVNKSTAFLGQDQDFFTQAKVRHMVEFSHHHHGDLQNMKILDVGCGVGTTIHFLQLAFGNIAGIDVSPGSIDTARERFDNVLFDVGSGTSIPHKDNTFDLVFAICVMHHIPPAEWSKVLPEMLRVTKPGGLIAIFEHNPYNPLTRIAVNNCEFDKDAVLLSRRTTARLYEQAKIPIIEQKYILFFPFERAILSSIEKGLSWLPLGAQYYVLGQKPSSP